MKLGKKIVLLLLVAAALALTASALAMVTGGCAASAATPRNRNIMRKGAAAIIAWYAVSCLFLPVTTGFSISGTGKT